MTEKQKTQPEKISEEFAELDESKNEQMMSPDEKGKLSFWNDFKGVKKGTVKDVKVKERERRSHNLIKLQIECEDKTVTEKIRNTGVYDQSNPFARFIEWYDIETREPSELLDLEVTFIKRSRGWKLYIPKSLDNYTKFRHQSDMMARKVGITFIRKSSFYDLFMISIIVGGVIYLFSVAASNILIDSGIVQNGAVAYLGTTILFSLLLSITLRTHTVLKQRAKRAKENNDLI